MMGKKCFVLSWLQVTSLLSCPSTAASLEQWYLICAPWLIGHMWSQLPTSRKWWSWGRFDSGPACFLPSESLQAISSSLQGDKCPTQNELSTCGTVPNPQTFPYGPLAADSPALTVPPLLASLGYGSDDGQSYWKREWSLCQPALWVSDESLAELINGLSAFRRPWGSGPWQQDVFWDRDNFL